MIGKRKLIGNVDDVLSYAVLHNSANILGRRLSNTSVVKRVCFVSQEAKDNAYQYFQMMEESVDSAIHTQVIVEGIAVKVTELRGVSF